MRPVWIGWITLCALPGARAQTHVVKKPETVVRAIAVYEWTGEAGKATASRVVPVSIYVNKQFEDAGIYISRPIPLALDPGTVFLLESAGVVKGTLEMAYARHYVSSGAPAFDDGWTGYAAYKAKAPEVVAKLKSGPISPVLVGGGKGPKLSTDRTVAADSPAEAGKADAKGAGDPAPAATPAAAPVDRSGAVGSGTTVSAGDPDGPAMRKRADDNSDVDAKDDAERPTLKRRTTPQQSAADAKAERRKKDTASVTGVGDLNDDPDRPSIHRGKPASRLEEEDLPPLKGLPKDIRQMVAVSDAKDRPEHDFTRPWESDAERANVLARLRAIAAEKLTEYDRHAGADRASAPAGVPARPGSAHPVAGGTSKPGASNSAGTKLSAAGRNAARVGVAKVPAAPVPPADEVLNGYTLSYGGAATFVYSASAKGADGVVRYVTVVAQQEPNGQMKEAMSSVTDQKHLDRTPWMRPVDAVDADASNRASLLFEMRAEKTRQFALYRVIGAQAEQVFETAVPE